eukprot:gene16371-22316_t
MSSKQDYNRIVKGKLSFKGESSAKLIKPKRKHESVQPNESCKDTVVQDIGVNETDDSSAHTIQILNGTGRITSSGITVQGIGTEFMNQLTPGDAIIITHPTSLLDETKIVRMVLSNVSIGISSSFSTDLISTTPFRFIKAPKDTVKEEDVQKTETLKKHKVEVDAFGTYASEGGQKFVYRVKKGGSGGFGGYKVITETTDRQLSREELLDKRLSKKSDR